MNRFKETYLIEVGNHFFAVLNVNPVGLKGKLMYFKIIDQKVVELGEDDPYDNWETNIEKAIEEARKICKDNGFTLWTF